ncbi:4119_t:CDS:2, partial [Dentiscutata heterogama]
KLRELEENENLTPKYPCITRWATFLKATETLLSTRNNTSFWTKLDKFFNILKPYDYIVKILESDKVTLGHISVCWAWLRKIINELPDDSNFLDFKDLMLDEIDNRWEKIYNPIFVITWFLHPHYHGKGIREERLLQLQEDAYSLFCLLYPDKDNDAFIDEWLMYQNYEKFFNKNLSLNHPSITQSPLRYWRTVFIHAPNLAEFACRLFSIPPNSATSERVWSLMGNIHTEQRNRLTPSKTAKMAKIAWYLKGKADKISSTSTINMLDKDDELDDCDYEVDEIISNLEE